MGYSLSIAKIFECTIRASCILSTNIQRFSVCLQLISHNPKAFCIYEKAWFCTEMLTTHYNNKLYRDKNLVAALKIFTVQILFNLWILRKYA